MRSFSFLVRASYTLSQVFGTEVMVEVAKNLDAPIKGLIFNVMELFYDSSCVRNYH